MKRKASEAYLEKLRDPRWQKMRLKIMERDGFKCQICGDDKTTLNVHHRYYTPGANPWEYLENALVTLCEPCHGEETEARREAEDDLLRVCRRRFFASEIGQISVMLEFLPLPSHPAAVMEAICAFIHDDDRVKQIVDEHFKDMPE